MWRSEKGRTERERTGPAAVFVPESVTVSEIAERLAHDAREHRADHAARHRPLRDAGWPQVDVVHAGVRVHVALESLVREHAGQIVPVAGPG